MGRAAKKFQPLPEPPPDPRDLPGPDGLILRYQCARCGLKARDDLMECPSCPGVCSFQPVRLPPHRAVIRVEDVPKERFGPNRFRGLSPEDRERLRLDDLAQSQMHEQGESRSDWEEPRDRDPSSDSRSQGPQAPEGAVEDDSDADEMDEMNKPEAVDMRSIQADDIPRTPTGWTDFDAIFADGDNPKGGLPQPSCITLAATPGCGKSRTTLELAAILCQQGQSVLIAAGEESAPQIKARFNTMRIGKRYPRTLKKGTFLIVATSSLEDILDLVDEHDPDVLIVDSVFVIESCEVEGQPGKPTQTVYCMQHLYWRTHGTNVYEGQRKFTSILIVHGTKENIEAGVNQSKHAIDVPLFAERVHADGSPRPDQRKPVAGEDTFFRLFVTGKNRFGAQDPVACFHMTKPYGIPVPHKLPDLEESRAPRAATEKMKK